MTWHTLPDCGPDEPTLHGRCYHCGAREPEPVEDFDNGYCDELSGWGHSNYSLDWVDRANMRVLTMRDFLRRYKGVDSVGALAMRASPMLTRIRGAQ